MSDNGYYKNNIQGAVPDHEKTPEKTGLLNDDDRYTPVANAQPMMVKSDDRGNVQNELSNMAEGDELLPPVKLSPGWEDRDLNDEELNFRNIQGEDTEKAPTDKFKIVYLILMLHGIGTLMPWNVFITANSYFVDYKLATNSTGGTTEYRKNFVSYIGICAQIPNLILNAINLFCQCGGGSTSIRVVVSIIIIVVMFICTTILAMIDSSEWPGIFFALTVITVVIVNSAVGVYQNCVYGLAACLPMKYTNAVVLGSNLSGTICSIVSILASAGSPNPRTAAIYYFISAVFILLVAFDTYFALPLLPFYKYWQRKSKAKDTNVEVASTGPPPYWQIFKKIWVQAFGVWFVFLVTLTCFPALQVNVKKLDDNFPIPDEYYTSITCFLFFNAFAMLGNLATEWIRKPGPRWVWIPIVLRVLFIPFFLLCNYRPEYSNVPTIITNDYAYIAGGILMAFTSGYFSSLTMMYGPKSVEPQHAGVAAMICAFFLIFGIVCGVNFSLAVAYFAEL